MYQAGEVPQAGEIAVILNGGTVMRRMRVISLGSVKDSTVIGKVNLKTRVKRIDQNQSGLLNKQKMSIGTVD